MQLRLQLYAWMKNDPSGEKELISTLESHRKRITHAYFIYEI